MGLALSGCAGFSIDDAVPAGARTRQVAQTTTAPIVGTGPSAPRQTGEFPNLNVVPKPAAEQFTEEEATRTTSELLRAQQRARQTVASFSSKGEGERLRRLGDTHGDATIDEIEAE
jgi:hypothetical protein